MGLFGKSKAEKQELFDSERAKEATDFAARTIEFPEMEVKCEIWWEGRWFEKGSRNNDETLELNIQFVINKSKNTQEKDGMERNTQEIGYLVPISPTEVDVEVFGKVVNKLKPQSAKKVLEVINSRTPVKVGLGHCYANEDDLPDRYATWIDLRLKNTRRKKTATEKSVKKKEKPVDQMAEKVKAFGANQEVVGLSYNASTLEPIVGSTEEGSTVLRVVLKRNPKNQYDENAVEVRVNGNIAGHIPRTDNLKYHERLDIFEKAGKVYECDAIVCWETKSTFKEIRLDLKVD